MAEQSKIEWCDSTFNSWVGCTKVSPACDHCYAEAMMDTRMGRVKWGAGQPRSRTSAANWKQPLRWNAQPVNGNPFVQCQHCGWRGEHKQFTADGHEWCPSCQSPEWSTARRRVFCASLADVFDNEAPPEWRVDLLWLVRTCDNLDFLLLTKRVGNVVPMLRQAAAYIQEQINGTQAERDAGLRAGEGGRPGDRLGWQGVALEEAHIRPVDRRHESDALCAREGGDWKAGELPAGASDDRRQASLRGGRALGLAALQRPDSAGNDGEPQRWPEAEQSTVELGTGDLQRAAAPCDQGAGSRTSRRTRVQTSEDGTDGNASGADPRAAGERRTDQGSRRGVRIEPDGGIRNLPRRELEALLAWVEHWLSGNHPANIWLGATICNQSEADRDIPKLLATPAAKRFLSIEPMLGPIDLDHIGVRCDAVVHGAMEPCIGSLDWIICGGESGPQARPMHPDWARSLRDQCAAAGVPFLFKQWGEWAPGAGPAKRYAAHWSDGFLGIPRWGYFDEQPRAFWVFGADAVLSMKGKKAAGRLLDGIEHNGVPHE